MALSTDTSLLPTVLACFLAHLLLYLRLLFPTVTLFSALCIGTASFFNSLMTCIPLLHGPTFVHVFNYPAPRQAVTIRRCSPRPLWNISCAGTQAVKGSVEHCSRIHPSWLKEPAQKPKQGASQHTTTAARRLDTDTNGKVYCKLILPGATNGKGSLNQFFPWGRTVTLHQVTGNRIRAPSPKWGNLQLDSTQKKYCTCWITLTTGRLGRGHETAVCNRISDFSSRLLQHAEVRDSAL